MVTVVSISECVSAHLSLVVFLLQFGVANASLLQHGGELSQLLVSLGERGEGLLLQLLSLSHPVDSLQPENQNKENNTLRVTANKSKSYFVFLNLG